MHEAVPGLALGGDGGAEIRGYAAQELGVGQEYWGWPRVEWLGVLGAGLWFFGGEVDGGGRLGEGRPGDI